MKEQIIYIADDGKKFETKKECLEYEYGDEKKRAQCRKLYSEKRAEENCITMALAWMQLYKNNSNSRDYYVQPTSQNISDCMNLSRIEKIYINAKKEFLKSLNTPDLSLRARVQLISHASFIFNAAIEKRDTLRSNYESWKKQFEKSSKRLVELEEQIKKINEELKHE